MTTEKTNEVPATAGGCSATPACYVAVMRSYYQVSPDYDTAPETQTKILKPETTVQEIMEWAKSRKGLGASDLIISKAT